MDHIYINEWTLYTTIGVYPWEQVIKQKVVISIELGVDVSHAARRDNLEDTLDYAKLTSRIQTFVEAGNFQLIESLSEQIADLVLSEFAVPWLKLRVAKPNALKKAGEVGVFIERKHA